MRDEIAPNAFLLILWSGGISYVRPFFPPQARKDRVPRGPRSLRNGRAGFSFLVYTISKNALRTRLDQIYLRGFQEEGKLVHFRALQGIVSYQLPRSPKTSIT